MFATKNDLSEDVRTKAIELLNARLADAIDLATQIKQAHWNVKGPNFIALHEQLRVRESLYGEFITEASRLSVDALVHSLDRPEQLVALYGILSRIRLVAGADPLIRSFSR